MIKPKAPLIGLTTYGAKLNNEYSLPAPYVEYVRRAGGIPVMLPPGGKKLKELCKFLDGIILSGGGEIVSWHHQSVNKVSDELTITARSSDGVIEGLELDSHRWLVAVQWHPELSAAQDKLQQQLFDALVVESKLVESKSVESKQEK